MDLLELAKNYVLQAGDAIMSIYGTSEFDDKSDASPVTKADRLSNRIITEALLEHTPSIGILSEESIDDKSRLANQKVWILDPLDGTMDFLQMTDEFTVMLGLVDEGRPMLGVVYQPTTKALYFAQRGQGAYKVIEDQEPVQINGRTITNESRATLLVSRNHLLPLEQQFAQVNGITDLVPCGSAGLKSCLIAEGRADLYINSSNKTSEWDICAADIIVQEAGGTLTDLKGNQITYNKTNALNLDGFVVSSNAGLAAGVISAVAK